MARTKQPIPVPVPVPAAVVPAAVVPDDVLTRVEERRVAALHALVAAYVVLGPDAPLDSGALVRAARSVTGRRIANAALAGAALQRTAARSGIAPAVVLTLGGYVNSATQEAAAIGERGRDEALSSSPYAALLPRRTSRAISVRTDVDAFLASLSPSATALTALTATAEAK